jgi:hypothetical protein
MASYHVNPKKLKRKKGIVYQIEYRIGKKRIREFTGSNFKEAEILFSSVERSSRPYERRYCEYCSLFAKDLSIGEGVSTN